MNPLKLLTSLTALCFSNPQIDTVTTTYFQNEPPSNKTVDEVAKSNIQYLRAVNTQRRLDSQTIQLEERVKALEKQNQFEQNTLLWLTTVFAFSLIIGSCIKTCNDCCVDDY